jgi:superoxide reductase
MTQKEEIYRCNVCGNAVKIIQEGVGTLVCCNEPMELIEKEN